MQTTLHKLFERFVSLTTPDDKRSIAARVWRLLNMTYPNGLYGATIENLIDTPGMWKVVRKADNIIAGVIYRDVHNSRKVRLIFHDGTDEGKRWVKKILQDDILMGRSWGEFSGALEKVLIRLGATRIPAEKAEKLLGHPITKIHDDGFHYDREVSPGIVKTQILLGPL